MYRAVGWKALHEGLDLDEEAAVADLARRATIQIENGVVSIDGVDVTRAIRTPEIDRAATRVAVSAPQDGTYIAAIHPTTLLDPIMGNPKRKVARLDFAYLGSASKNLSARCGFDPPAHG